MLICYVCTCEQKTGQQEECITYALQGKLNVAAIDCSMFVKGTRKGDKGEHKEKDHNVQDHEESQKGKVRLDPSAKLPYEKKDLIYE